MMRRVIGLADVEDIRGIEDVEARSIAASLALNIVPSLIMRRYELKTIDELVELTTACRGLIPLYGFLIL